RARRSRPHSFPTRRSSDLDHTTLGSIDTGLRSNHPLKERQTVDLRGVSELWVHPRGRGFLLQRGQCSSDEHPDEPHNCEHHQEEDRKSTRLNSSHVSISYA